MSDKSLPDDRNARLIAAAPDLYSALSIMLEVFGENEHEGPFALRNARAALAKVDGREKSSGTCSPKPIPEVG